MKSLAMLLLVGGGAGLAAWVLLELTDRKIKAPAASFEPPIAPGYGNV